MFTRFLNVGLRLATLISRFVLLFLLAKYMPPAEFATFGLIIAFVSFGVLFVGGEFYQFTLRELISVSPEERGWMLVHQGCAGIMLYVVLTPAYIILAFTGIGVSDYLILALMILICEHISQEVYRILVVLNHQLHASIQLFMRSAIWVWSIPVAIVAFDYAAALEHVLYLWLVFSFASILFGAAGLKHDLKFVSPFRLDWLWIYKGVRVAGLFFFSALAFRALTTMDKYTFAYLTDQNTTAAYVFFFGIAMVVVNILDPAVIAFSYPKLIAFWREENLTEFKKECWAMARHTILLIACAGIVIYIAAPYVLDVLGNQVYSANSKFLPILLLMAALQGLSLVPHYGLYAMGRDRALIASHYLALAVFIVSVAFLSTVSKTLAVPIALCIAFFMLLLVKARQFSSYLGTTSQHWDSS